MSGENGSTNGSTNAKGGLELTAKDFKTDQEVRWCPGCGDYAILAAMQGFEIGRASCRERVCSVV